MNSDDENIGVIVLAAGASARLGVPKQLLNYKGKPLLQHTLDRVNELESIKSVVVLGASADEIVDHIRFNHSSIVVNGDWSTGLSSSIICGLTHLNKHWPSIDYVLFVVGDQPYLSLELLQELISLAKQESHPVIASTYSDQVGVPALFHRSLFGELSRLTGDEGAKKVIQNNIDRVGLVSFEQGEVDIDTSADYENLLFNS